MKLQKFHLNRIKYLIPILLYFVFIPNVCAVVTPTNEFYVNDYAGILSYETENYITENSKRLNEVDGTQIVVVTVNNLEGMSLEDYSLKLFRNFGIGDKNRNNGLLLLLALEEREFRVEVGYGLEGILPDGKTGRFQDQYIIPYLKEDNWDQGIKNGYDAFFKEIVTLNDINIDYQEPINNNNNNSTYNEEKILLLSNLLIAIFITIVIYSFGKSGKIRSSRGDYDSFSSGSSYSSGSHSSRSSGGGGRSGGGGSSRRF